MTAQPANLSAAGKDEAPLPLLTCIGWGSGTLAVASAFNVVNVILLRYLVDFVGIGAVLAGSLIGLSKLYDALIDPVVGVASDRTRTRIGRRRPYLLVGGLLLALSVLALFNVPSTLGNDAKVYFAIGGLLLYATGYAAFSVPYMAMPAEMTTGYHERSRLISFRIYAVAVASVIASFIGPVLIARGGGGQAGHTIMSVALAVLVILAVLFCFFTTARAPFHFQTPVRIGTLRKLQLLAANRPFVVLLGIKLTQLMALAVTQASTPFLFKRVLQLSDTMLGLYFMVFYGIMILSQTLWVRAARRHGKRIVYLLVTLVYGLGYVSWYFVVPGEPLWVLFARALVLGATGGGVLLLGQSLIPDVMEWDYRRTGLRREGMLSAIYTLIEKVAYALGAAITGVVLGRAGYIQGTATAKVTQPHSAIEAIYALASFAPMALLLLSALLLCFYRLSERMLVEAPLPTMPDDL